MRGAIVGAVLGDAFGGPFEGASPGTLARLVSTRAAKASPWSYTDDGAMNIAVAESIVAAGTVAPEHILRRLAAHYEPARGFGRGMKLALEAFASGTPWDRCAFAAWREGSQGNGGAVRITPVACVTWSSPAAFTRAVDLTTRVTHTHEEAVVAAQFHANAVVLALQTDETSFDSQAFVVELRHRTRDLPPWVDAALLRVGKLVDRAADHVEAGRALGTSPLARESVFAALWAFLLSPATYAGAVTSAALLGGDVDSICAMTGALAGALHGMNGVPVPWLRNVDHERPSIEELLELCDDLSQTLPCDPAAT